MTTIQSSDRIGKLPEYLFVELEKAKKRACEQGRDVIDLGIGDPDLPVSEVVLDSLKKALDKPENHRYPSNKGLTTFRIAIAKWYKKRFSIELDPDTEILPILGAKDGITHLPLALLNHSDIALVPDPGYPAYYSSVVLAGGVPYLMPLLEENNFLPDLDTIDMQVAQRAKLLYLNYPNNPTTSCASIDYFQQVAEFAQNNNIIVAHDMAYSELYYDNYRPMSILEVPNAKDFAVEFYSLSKTYSIAGWRIGFVIGNRDVISLLAKIKSNYDSGMFCALQEAAISALEQEDSQLDDMRKIYQERRDLMVNAFKNMKWEVEAPLASFYLWIKVPSGYSSMEMAELLLEKADIVVTPGRGFGKNGEGFIRISLTTETKRLEEAIDRIERIKC